MIERHLQIDALIELAKKLEREGSPEQAERLYHRALQTADLVFGPVTPAAGVAVLELMTFYEDQGDADNAEPLRERLKEIFVLHGQTLLKSS
jgi:hypothetical protein